MKEYIECIDKIVRRNEYGLMGKSQHNKVNLESWQFRENCGDTLGPVICKWILMNRGISIDKEVSNTKHLMSVGSIIGSGNFDSTVWGSGIHMIKNIDRVFRKKRKYDIRALRGPITGDIMSFKGYSCNVYGDPAVLMNKIYKPISEKKYEVSIIPNYSLYESYINTSYNIINMGTNNYESIIDQIVASNFIISSSLHGIILAETYGIPTVFLAEGMEKEMMKYYDWYYSTERYTVKVARNIADAFDIGPMDEIKNLEQIQDRLLNVFPYDLWEITNS